MKTFFKNARPAGSRTVASMLIAAMLAAGGLALPHGTHAAEAAKIDTSRLVSVGGDVTEIIYALGEENRLIARDSTSIYPEAASKLPDVGYMRALSPEGVLAVKPT